jgi:hypothetical protein
MRIKTRPDDVSMLQMNDWLAELRDQDRAEATREEDRAEATREQDRAEATREQDRAEAAREQDRAQAAREEAAGSGAPVAAAPNGSAAPAETGVPAWASAPSETPARAGAPAETRVPTRVGATADVSPAASAPVRAVIGDEIRMPIMWCEMGSCISWYTHLAALGEADTRARAIAAGWRIDALGRLTCPQCQQTDPRFWASCAVVPWDRYTAIARTARITAVRSDGARGMVPEISHDRGRMASRDPRRAASGHLGASGHLAASPVESAWQRSHAAARAM